MTPSQALRIAARDTVGSLFNRTAWRDVRAGLIAVAFLLLRLAMLLTFPLSVPLMAWTAFCEARARRSCCAPANPLGDVRRVR